MDNQATDAVYHVPLSTETAAALYYLHANESNYNMNTYNSINQKGTVNLVSGSTNTYNSVLFFEPDCKNYKYVVQKIIFTDGTEWQNPYIYTSGFSIKGLIYNCTTIPMFT